MDGRRVMQVQRSGTQNASCGARDPFLVLHALTVPQQSVDRTARELNGSPRRIHDFAVQLERLYRLAGGQ
ncbi:hypothetical protein DAETH_33080 (plasmid) [Deinococcus aetherius]|uniref:Uncharacterized protein n=1 Tax=Deinococcus aetherius TaxID=200252 RepID=A0ABM8AHU9_9DEIO|nr:hypothetical protein [Deinococcus aetherius]BDP43339.1 hypothetical protein DAETH_33080 [Deinococcus aetherius]